MGKTHEQWQEEFDAELEQAKEVAKRLGFVEVRDDGSGYRPPETLSNEARRANEEFIGHIGLSGS